MLEDAEVVAAKLKSEIMYEREIIDFKLLNEELQNEIAKEISEHKNTPEIKFSICEKDTFFTVLDESKPLYVPKMHPENKLRFFEEIEVWLEDHSYTCKSILDSRKNIVGFTVSWKDLIEIEPFIFDEVEEKEIEVEEMR